MKNYEQMEFGNLSDDNDTTLQPTIDTEHDPGIKKEPYCAQCDRGDFCSKHSVDSKPSKSIIGRSIKRDNRGKK